MSELHFAEPQWAHAVWGVLLVLATLVWLERRSGRALERFVEPALQASLVSSPTRVRRWLRLALLGLSGFSLVLALMRPQWGVDFVTTPRVGAEIMIALDVSKSMLAEDVAPNRLERAKAEIRDLLPYLAGDQVGLIAFAGRASVLCPLTPDFGFLRLVLDGVHAGSVRRGGTRLEEPIRKAVDGFGDSGDLSRVILLITDGEDHDSFALDAAERAAERGVHILAIGFGDEDGSEIRLTDPETGARATLRDADGRPVVSRLDGDLLRELAMTSEGVYVPAGTGVLDLESIFEAHIRPLMRASGEERGKTVRKDGFQWPILLALLALLASAASQASRTRLLAALLVALPLATAGESLAQSPPAEPSETAAPASDENVGSEGEEGEGRPRLELPGDAREAFNRGLATLQEAALDDAERLFEAARRGARSDGEVRFRATYNLGWVEVERAEQSLQEDPQSALAALERSADWFREAVALRPSNDQARGNLEIVLKRALALADSLAQREPGDIATQLDELIAAQRTVGAAIRAVAESSQRSDDPAIEQKMRVQFKRVAVEERKILSQASGLTELAGGELDSLEDRSEEDLTPQERMRTAQLSGLLHYVHRARERIGQARSQLRQYQAERAWRRAASGLSDLKRARDQLLDPVRVLDSLLNDALQLAGETRALAAAGLGLALQTPAASERSESVQPPAWLTTRYLGEAQTEIARRCEELDARLTAGLGEAGQASDPQQLALLERVAEAQPYLEQAHGHFSEAAQALEAERLMEVAQSQADAVTALSRARERFLELKGLIEVAYADEMRIGELLDPARAEDPEQIAEYAQALSDFQQQNLERVQRMTPMLEKERTTLEEQLAAPEDPEAEQTEQKQALERLTLAEGILALTDSAMQGASESLAGLARSPDLLVESRERVQRAVNGLENLRRLFFSIVEHLRDTSERQVDLNDETEQTAALAQAQPESGEALLGRLGSHQRKLATFTEKLAQALHDQSFEDPAALLGDQIARDEAAAQAASETLTRASELVLTAGQEMTAAADGLTAEALELEAIRQRQDDAVNRLAEALALLQPPQEQQPGEQQEQSEEQQAQPEQSEPSEQQQEQAGDPAQLLQSVRDREAERHRRQGERAHRGYEPVEKDW